MQIEKLTFQARKETGKEQLVSSIRCARRPAPLSCLIKHQGNKHEKRYAPVESKG